MVFSPVKIALVCKTCGTEVILPEHPTDETPVACRTCGQVAGTYGEVKQGVLDFAKAELEKRGLASSADTATGDKPLT